MSQRPNEIELLLSRVLSPVEPPERLKESVQARLEKWTDQAVDDIESWEI